MKIDLKIIKKLGFEDYRDFAIALGDWANNRDFTYQGEYYDPDEGATWQKFLELFYEETL